MENVIYVKTLAEEEYKGAFISITETPENKKCVDVCICDVFTGDIIEEWDSLTLTCQDAMIKAKSFVDGLMDDEQLKLHMANGFAYVRYIS